MESFKAGEKTLYIQRLVNRALVVKISRIKLACRQTSTVLKIPIIIVKGELKALIAVCEAEAVICMILLAKMAKDAPFYFVHLTNSLALDFIINARERGQKKHLRGNLSVISFFG